MRKEQTSFFKSPFRCERGNAESLAIVREDSNLLSGRSWSGGDQDAGQAEAGWKLFPDVMHKFCANCEEVMFKES